jgi:hypothetical protein
MKKSEYLEALNKILDDKFVAVTLVYKDDSISIVGNMTVDAFEDLIIELASAITEAIHDEEIIH